MKSIVLRTCSRRTTTTASSNVTEYAIGKFTKARGAASPAAAAAAVQSTVSQSVGGCGCCSLSLFVGVYNDDGLVGQQLHNRPGRN